VKTAQSSQLVVNLDAAQKLGVTIPESVVERAKLHQQ
jgi:putative ABC transport system substrate-binding protein